MKLSSYINAIQEPQTILMAKLSRALKAEGKDVVDLSLGEPDFATPQHICDAAKNALDSGFTKYPPVAGYPELREAICKKLKRDNNLDYTIDNIVVSTGAKQSLANVIHCLLDSGDEAIIPTPYWVSYATLVKMAGASAIFLPCGTADGFKLTAEKLKAAITSKTRLLIYSSPSNPAGSVYTKEEIEALAQVLKAYPDITVISDEIYEYINYGTGHFSMASIPHMKDRTVVVNGFAKGYAMTGWRLGYIAAPVEMAKACEKLQSQITSGANSMAQRAAIEALIGDQTPTQDMLEAYRTRRDYFIPELATIPHFKVVKPDGAFYAFVDISAYFGKEINGIKINDANDFAMLLLNNAYVTGVSGTSFGDPNCIRFSFATSIDRLEEAIVRLKKMFCN
jgi:aspartate aminotransferase